MGTQTTICNLALTRVRARRIGDIDTDQSAESIACLALWDQAVESLLAQFPWRFARKVVTLELATGADPAQWRYEYKYPNGALHVRRIFPRAITTVASERSNSLGGVYVKPGTDLHPIPFEIGSTSIITAVDRAIFTDEVDAVASCTWEVKDPQQWSPLFQQALAWLLAMDLATELGGDSTKYYRDKAETWFTRTMNAATVMDLNQEEPGRKALPKSILARLSGAATVRYDNTLPWR